MSDKQYTGGVRDCECGLHFVSPVPITEINGLPIKQKWAVFCMNCGKFGPIADTPRYAIKAWNTREGVMMQCNVDEMQQGKDTRGY